MARLSRFTQKIFGSGAGVNQISKFGSLFTGSPAFTTDPGQAMSLSNWLTGWLAAAIGGNSPAIEDMNAAMFVFAYQIAAIMQMGVPEYDAGTTYYIGQFASNGAGKMYYSLTDGNIGNALSDVANWKVMINNPFTTAGDILYSLANGVPQRREIGDEGDVLTAVGGVPAWTPSGSLVKLATFELSNVATLPIPDIFTDDYDVYQIEVAGLVPVVNADDLELRYSKDNGATWLGTGAYYYTFNFARNDNQQGGSGFGAQDKIAPWVNCGNSGVGLGGACLNMTMKFYKPAATDIFKNINFYGNYIDNTSLTLNLQGNGGMGLDTDAINALQFKYAGGNIAKGTVIVYGVKK